MKKQDPVFAFNDVGFSDRVLRIEIEPCQNVCVTSLYKPLVKKLLSFHTTVDDSGSSSSSAVKVITLNISSRILSSESTFFSQLFKNGAGEDCSNEVTLKINASELSSLMDLLNFMYISILSATESVDLLNVQKAAEKFEVSSCIKYVHNCPKSSKGKLYYYEPSSAIMNEETQPLKDAAKKYLVERFNNFSKCEDELITLPLSALEVVLGSDGLRVNSETDVFCFIVKWAKAHGYGFFKPNERDKIIYTRLLRFVYIPYLCIKTLQPCFCHEPNEPMGMGYFSLRLLEGVYFNSGHLYNSQRTRVAQDPRISNRGLVLNRVYTYHPIKFMQFKEERPYTHRSVVYFFLTKQHLMTLFPSKTQYSAGFYLAHYRLYLAAQCNKSGSSYHFGLSVAANVGLRTCTFDYEFAVLMKNQNSEIYHSVSELNRCTLDGKDGKARDGEPNLISWTDLMADDSEYFIDGILHLRAELMLVLKPTFTLFNQDFFL